MKDIAQYIYGEDCSKCKFLEPHVEKRAEEMGIQLEKIPYSEVKDMEITSIPMLLWDKAYDYDWIIALINDKN